MPLASTIPTLTPFSLLANPSISLMIVSGIVSIAFDVGIISWNDHHQSPLRTTSLNLALVITPSSRRTCSPTSTPMAPPRTSTPSLRMPPRSSSLATSLFPPRTTSGLPSTAARTTSSQSSWLPLRTLRATPPMPTLTLRISPAPRTDTPPGSAATKSVERAPSSYTSD